MSFDKAAEIHHHHAALCARWAEEDVTEATGLRTLAPAVAERRLQEAEAWSSRAVAHTLVAAALAGEEARA